MNEFAVLDLAVAVLFSVMAYRAFCSGSRSDRLLGAGQGASVILLLGPYREIGLYLLLVTAAWYLASQLLTGARPLSLLLPLAGAMAVIMALLY